MTNTAPIYYAPRPEGSDSASPIIKIMHGVQGYWNAAVSPENAAELNRRAGHSAGNIEAAIACSMFDCWHNFDKISADFDKRQAEQEAGQ